MINMTVKKLNRPLLLINHSITKMTKEEGKYIERIENILSECKTQ